MNLAALARNAGRLQETRGFKICASALLALLVVGGYATYAVLVASGRITSGASLSGKYTEEFLASPTGQALASVVGGSTGLVGLAVAAALTLAVWLAIIWLGAGLGYLAFNILGAAAAALLLLADPSGGASRLVVGLALIAQGFVVGIQALRALFSGHHPVSAIARNVLAEAVRLKISLVFIVALAVALASLPALLDPEQPLRYRVQSFLQWGTGGAFWILATLTLLFGVATVTFEQRDKVIWQTATKPVAPWQYVLGKWLGLVGLNAVLLLVCSGGVFLFVEYLRATPAQGESSAYVAAGDADVAEDRLILETQVLTAVEKIYIQYPPDVQFTSEAFRAALDERIAAGRLTDPAYGSTDAAVAAIATELLEEVKTAYRAVGDGDYQDYVFAGLADARERGRPITLRYKIDAAGGRPDIFYNLTLYFPDVPEATPDTRRSGIGYFHNVPLSPALIAPDGTLTVRVINGRLGVLPDGQIAVQGNGGDISFAKDALQVTSPAGSYRLNYLRVAAVLWVKLAFLAMIAVWAGTFLSFPVASLISFGAFLIAEMSGWLANASDIYGTKDYDGNVVLYKVIGSGVADAIAAVFKVYSDLNPVNALVEGLYLPWRVVSFGVLVLALMTALFYALAVVIFARRELATYSGQ